MAILSLHGAELPAVEAVNLSNYTPIFQKDDKSLIKIDPNDPNTLADTFYDYYLNVHKFIFKLGVGESTSDLYINELVTLIHNSNIEVVAGRNSWDITNNLNLQLNIKPTHSFSEGVLNCSVYRYNSNNTRTVYQNVVLYDKTNERFEISLALYANSTWIIEGFFVFLPPVT